MAREDIPLDLLDQTILWGERKLERKRKEREEERGERSSTFSLDFSVIGPFPAKQEAKFFHATRASHRDKSPGFSTNFER